MTPELKTETIGLLTELKESVINNHSRTGQIETLIKKLQEKDETSWKPVEEIHKDRRLSDHSAKPVKASKKK